MATVDFEQIAPTYDAARALGPEALESWRLAVTRHLSPLESCVLDLGSGTGQFAHAFAHWWGARIVAVEPAAAMRREALRKRAHPNVAYVGGRGEEIPLRRSTCDWAWLSSVLHHLHDLRACAKELGRVLHPCGRVLVRGAFAGRQDHVTMFRFFPAARRIVETFPTIEATVAAFAVAGFQMEALESVAQVSAPSLRHARERIRLRADSTLQPLSDDEFAEGMAALDRAIASETAPTPVLDRLDLLVLRKSEG